MTVTYHAKLTEGRAAAPNYMSLLEDAIIMTQLIGDGDCCALGEICNIIFVKWPDINPAVAESMLSELKACINHKTKNMRYCLTH